MFPEDKQAPQTKSPDLNEKVREVLMAHGVEFGRTKDWRPENKYVVLLNNLTSELTRLFQNEREAEKDELLAIENDDYVLMKSKLESEISDLTSRLKQAEELIDNIRKEAIKMTKAKAIRYPDFVRGFNKAGQEILDVINSKPLKGE